MILSRYSGLLAPLTVLVLAAPGCANNWAFRQGKAEAKKGNWDMAVARLTKAADADPDNLEYRMALDAARAHASRAHYDEGMKHLAEQDLTKAQDELDIAAKFDPSNRVAVEQLASVERRVRKRQEDSDRINDLDAMKARAQATRIPSPYLSPRSTAPISLKFLDTSLQKIFDTLGKLAGVNVVMDPDFRDKKVNFDVIGVTFEEALDHLCLLHHLFYKVIDQNTLVIAAESPQKRRSYDDLVVQTFYLRYTATKDVTAVVKGLITGGTFKVVENATLGAISVTGTPDQVAMAAHIIDANDKPRGEVMIEVRIMEINRALTRKLGISLANYEAKVSFAPFSDTVTDPVAIRAHLISSVNLSDFVVSLPSTLVAQFSDSRSGARILAAPRLRAAEGEKTALKVGTEIAIPTTTFTAPQTGVGSFGPATSFSTRNVGVNLELTPTVSTAGEITLKIAAEFSSIGPARDVSPGLSIPDILTRNVSGILRLRDGETSLIGGLLAQAERNSNNSVAGLGAVPLLNKIFGTKRTDTEDNEVVISITPHLLRSPILEDQDLAAYQIGTDEVKRVPGVRQPLLRLAEPAPTPSPSPSPAAVAPSASPAGAGGPEAGPARPAARPTPSPAPATTPAPMTTTPPAATIPSSPAEDPLAEPLPGAAPVVGPGPAQPPTFAPSSVPPGASSPATAPAADNGVNPRSARAQFAPMAVGIKPGEIGSVSVVLIGARDLLAVELVLSYDPSVIEAVDVAAGALLSLDGAPVGAEKQSDRGRYRVHFTRTTPVGSGVGAVAVFSFRGLKPGNASFGVTTMNLTTVAGAQAVSVSGAARITVEP